MTDEYTSRLPARGQANAACSGVSADAAAGFPASRHADTRGTPARTVHTPHRASPGCHVRVPPIRNAERRSAQAAQTRVTISVRRPKRNRSIMRSSVANGVDR